MSGKKRHRNANEYLQYLKGGSSGGERHAFERELESDPFEKEAMEGLEMLGPGQAEADLLALHSRLRKRLGRRRRIAWYSVAATVASLLIVGTLFFQLHDFNPDTTEQTLGEGLFMPGTPAEAEAPDEAEPPMEEAGTPGPSGDEAMTPVLRTPEAAPEGPPVKERAGEPAAQPAGAVPEETRPERILHVEAEAARPEEQVQYDQVEPEADVIQAPQEISREEAGGRVEKRSERMMQPAAAQPAETRQKAISNEADKRIAGGEVSGMVLSGEDMQPLPGAAVVLKGSNLGVVTDMEGRFTLPLEDDSNRTVVASFVGMEPGEYQVNQGRENNLVMQPDATTLDELLVVGQGLQPAGQPAGAFSAVKLRDEPTGTSGVAMPSGGYESYKIYIGEQLRFPEMETAPDRVVVILGFRVTATGEIRDIVPLRSFGEAFTREAVRLVEEGPSWKPARDENGPTEEFVRLRIVFKK